jgi:glycosyltransferase involved in cell wall biosynthesis
VRASVVIATKDRAEFLEQAIRSLERQLGAPSFEVVVVDNGSADSTKQVCERAIEAARVPVRYVYEGEPNRGKARNRGVAAAEGYLILFCDDDVVVPPHWVASHEAAHVREALVVTGPIINVASHEKRPRPSLANYSRAFLCTCNVSLPRYEFERVGGFDEDFNLYGWEDTELGIRLRAKGVGRAFSWDAYLWHVKPAWANPLESEARKAVEKARMAARFIRKQPSRRTRMATGAHAANLLRGRYLLPESLLEILAGAAVSERIPPALRTFARAQFLDGIYTRELSRELD